MNSPTFLLLQNEGALMQGCFKSSLTALRMGSSADRGPLYVAFFNYATGLERLLKILLLLDRWHRDGKPPQDKELRGYGHDLKMLYESAKNLFEPYGVEWKTDFNLDGIDISILDFFSDFNKSSRYFNLDTLVGTAKTPNPLAEWEDLISDVYENDVHELKRVSNEEQVDAVIEMIDSHVTHVPSTSMGGQPQAKYSEFYQDHEKIRLVLPQVCWRLVKILVPLKELLIAVRTAMQEADLHKVREASVPIMEEFLDFVCEDKSIILQSEDWP